MDGLDVVHLPAVSLCMSCLFVVVFFLKTFLFLCQSHDLFSLLIQGLDNSKIQEQIIVDSLVDSLSL